MLDPLCLTPFLVLRFRLPRGVVQLSLVLTERPVSPRESVRDGPAKKGRGNKRTRHAFLITLYFVKMKNSAKIREEGKPGMVARQAARATATLLDVL
jgi:hypothetical protein